MIKSIFYYLWMHIFTYTFEIIGIKRIMLDSKNIWISHIMQSLDMVNMVFWIFFKFLK
jgi:hypothetical protein